MTRPSNGRMRPAARRVRGASRLTLRLKVLVEDKHRTAEGSVNLRLRIFLLECPWNQAPALRRLTHVPDGAEVLAHFTPDSGKVAM